MLSTRPPRSHPAEHLATTETAKRSPATVVDGTSQTVNSTACGSTAELPGSFFIWLAPAPAASSGLLSRDLAAGDVAVDQGPSQPMLVAAAARLSSGIEAGD